MKHARKISLILAIFYITITQEIPRSYAQSTPDIIINEIQIAGDKADDEFIELYNTTDHTIDLNGWKLRKRAKNKDVPTTSIESSVIDISLANTLSLNIPAKGYALWANSKGIFKTQTLEQLSSGNSFTYDTTDPYSIALFDTDNALIDAITWGTPHPNPFMPSISYPSNPPKNTSLERDLANNMLTPKSQPSPKNTTFIEEKQIIPSEDPKTTPPATTLSTKENTIRINEILPDPSDTDEFIELFNFGAEDIDLTGWSLHDASKTGNYTFKEAQIIKAQSYLTVFKDTFSFALNNTNESLTLFNPNNVLIDTVSYAKSKKDISYNASLSGWRWSDILTPNTPNQFSVSSVQPTSIPKHIYTGIPARLSVDVENADATYLWNFGDGKTSRLAETTHTYSESGTYTITLTTSTAIEDIVETFVRKIERLPKIKMRITGINPNPKGTDTDNEWVTIKNLSKKKVDLLDWSIATGTTKKTLTNHPIKESLTIKPGKEITLGNDIASFSLPNKIGFLELRQPDKAVADKVHYTKSEGIKEDEWYQKSSDKNWVWVQNDTVFADDMPDTENAATFDVTDDQAQNTETQPQNVTDANTLINMIDRLSSEELDLLKAQIEIKLKLIALLQMDTSSEIIAEEESPESPFATIQVPENQDWQYKQSLLETPQENYQEKITTIINQGIPEQKSLVQSVGASSLLGKETPPRDSDANRSDHMLRYINRSLASFLKNL